MPVIQDETSLSDDSRDEKSEPREPKLNFKPLSQEEVMKQAKKMKEERTLPIPPGGNVDLKTTLQWFALLSQPHWDRLAVYLFRLFPLIDREPKYIEVFAGPFTYDQIIRSHGGGKYKIMVKDLDKYKKTDREDNGFFSCYFEIPMSEHDPILNYAELMVDERGNRAYVDKLKIKGILDRDGRIIDKNAIQQQQQNQTDGSANGMMMSMFKDMLTKFMDLNREQQNNVRGTMRTDESAMAKALELVQKSGETGIQMVMERARQEDPTKMMTMMMTMMEKMNPPKVNDDSKDKLYMMMLQMQQESSKQQMAMMQSMMEMNKGVVKEEKDEFESMERVFKLANMMGFKKGNPVSETGGWADKLMDMAPSVIQSVTQIIGAAMMAKNSGGVVRPSVVPNSNLNNQTGEVVQEQVPQLPGGYLNRGYNPNPDPVPPTPKVTPISTPTNSNNQVNPNIPNQEQMNSFALYGSFVVNAIAQGVRGHEFAQSVTNMIGERDYLKIANSGEEQLFNALKATPLVWDELGVYGEDKIKLFVHEFCNMEETFKKEMEEEDEEDNEEGEE